MKKQSRQKERVGRERSREKEKKWKIRKFVWSICLAKFLESAFLVLGFPSGLICAMVSSDSECELVESQNFSLSGKGETFLVESQKRYEF